MNFKTFNTNIAPAMEMNGKNNKSNGIPAISSVKLDLKNLFLLSDLENLEKNSKSKIAHKHVSKIIKL